MATTAGTMARSRVIILRTKGEMVQEVKPSITIWPVSVPVSVEFCPLASRATPNSFDATCSVCGVGWRDRVVRLG